ncbi:MAG: hypothetical protein FWG84_03085 [Bacteroidales bacterium]|nr:hypothetical protein [Bacteroidales bacterium]
MKRKGLLSVFALFGIVSLSWAQNTIVNPNSSWATLRYGFGYEGTICNVETEYVFFDGESVVDGKTYKQVYACYDELHQYAYYSGLMREENQKTYFISIYSDVECLMYDFSLEEGTSFEYEDYYKFMGVPSPPILLYVNAVDYVEINGEMKKCIQLVLDDYHDYIVDTWIEGIGSMRGILYPCYTYFLAGVVRTFLCFFQDEELIYKNTEYEKCYYDNIEDLFPRTLAPDKVWHIEYGYPCPEGEGIGCHCFAGIQTIKIGDITTFHGIEYYELLTDTPNPEWEVITYVREKDRRMYFYVESCDKEYEMYDFNRQPGYNISYIDPLYPFSLFNLDNPCELTEEDLDLHKYFFTGEKIIEYDGVKRKWLQLDHQWPSDQYDIWVEGIGSMRGITYQVTQQLTEVHQLKDCYEAGELIFVNEEPQYCWVAATDCEAVNDLTAETCNPDCVLLTWSKPESDLQIEGYRVFRNEQPLNEDLLTVTNYIDDNLPDGIYEYCVIAYYTNGCISETSNCVTEMINVEESCEAVNDLTAETCNPDCVLLTWSKPESDLQIEGYRVFRNEQPLNEELLTVTTYVDENLPDGIYEYCVIAYYTNGCISETSNCVTEQITVSIDDFQNNVVHVFNDGNNMLHIVNAKGISFIMYDLLGKNVKFILPENDHVILNLSYLPKGLYVVVNQIKSLTFKIIIR